MGLELHSLNVAPLAASVEAPAPYALAEAPPAFGGWAADAPFGEPVADWGQVAPLEAQQSQADMVMAFARSCPGAYDSIDMVQQEAEASDAFAQLYDAARDARAPSCATDGAASAFADGARLIPPGLAALVMKGHPLSPDAPERTLTRAPLRAPARVAAAAKLSAALGLLAL